MRDDLISHCHVVEPLGQFGRAAVPGPMRDAVAVTEADWQ
jgi:hypothetical protein